MRIRVTGHNGYIGPAVVPMLLDAAYEVICLDSDLFERCTFGTMVRPVLSLRWNIRHVSEPDLQEIEAVVHLARLANDPLGDLNPTSPQSPSSPTTVSCC